MKKLQKLILPLLFIVIILLVYLFYFKQEGKLGSFSDFDPNNSAVKDIRVTIVHDRGIDRTPDGGAVFFASDRNHTVVQINADHISLDLESAQVVLLKGHLSQGNNFHAHDVVLE
jgi:cytochrome c-type biogenesis protein CcmE